MILSITAASIGSVSIVYLEKSKLAFSAYIHDRNFEGSELPGLLGIHEFRVTNNYVSVRDKNGKFILHAYIRIRDIPFLIDDLDQGRKLLLVGNFVRLLGTLGFPFEIIPRIMPISSEAFLKSVGKQIEDQKLVASSEGNLVSPARKARLERLQRIYDRMAKGEKAKDVGFLAHVMVDGADETKLVSELDTNVKTLISALESTLGIKAERLKGYEMYRTVTEFFRASSIVYPSRTFRVLTHSLHPAIIRLYQTRPHTIRFRQPVSCQNGSPLPSLLLRQPDESLRLHKRCCNLQPLPRSFPRYDRRRCQERWKHS